jgi:hypothetical protein
VNSDSSTSSPGVLDHVAVHRDLLAGAEQHDVVDHQLPWAHGPLDAVAPDLGPGLADHREAVERPLRAPLLHAADHGVGDDDHAEERDLPWPHDHHDHEEGADDGVEAGEDVGARDLAQ